MNPALAVRETLDYLLRSDEVLTQIVGQDSYGHDKIYEAGGPRPSGTEPPFVVYQLLSGREPAGTYTDNEELDGADFQVTAWGRNSQEVWMVSALVHDAITEGDWDSTMIPWVPIRVKRQESPGELPDRDTTWRQVPVRWRVDTSK